MFIYQRSNEMSRKLLDEVYCELEQFGIVDTRAEYCTQWLGRSECYLRTLRFLKQKPTIDVLAVLNNRLHYYAEHYSEQDGRASRLAARRLSKLADECTIAIESRSEKVWMKRLREA